MIRIVELAKYESVVERVLKIYYITDYSPISKATGIKKCLTKSAKCSFQTLLTELFKHGCLMHEQT